MIFTNTDKALLLRAARLLLADAKALEDSHGKNWVENDAAKQAKLEFDRLHRDVRDLKSLVKRLEAVTGPLSKRPTKKTVAQEPHQPMPEAPRLIATSVSGETLPAEMLGESASIPGA
jgi:hypothetical protein